ncbi:MAG: hypothetical protein PHG08_02130 [Bacilli bacterium]|jgi:hypothetical protein|nr:hypothetical protein [Bacilli bacterium]HHU23844.1 hypothetical protein [Acholeplasmataceae bacterium]
MKKEFLKEYTIDFVFWVIILVLNLIVVYISSGRLLFLPLLLIVPLVFQLANIFLFKSKSNRLISYLQYITVFLPSFVYYTSCFLWLGFALIASDMLWFFLIVLSVLPMIAVIMKDYKIYKPRMNKNSGNLT